MVANHFNSKGGDDPLFGHLQPPTAITETQRHAQARIVNGFARDIQKADLLANYVVLGDINDFEFSETVEILQGFQLLDLYYLLPPSERYSYVFEGNSQALDHILRRRRCCCRCRSTTRCTSTPSSTTNSRTTTRRSRASK